MISPVLVKKNQIKSDYLGEVIFDLLSQTFGLPKEFDFNVLVVSKEYIARPDLIALDAYGDTMFADVICKVNGISNPFELNEGMYLILPVPEDILKFTFEPGPADKEESTANAAPKVKAKTDKRKANEAIVGDARFRIDPNLGIIIY